jgi:uncharacterized protein YjbI with pentapeptide repeats
MYIHPVDFYPDRNFRVDPRACFVIMPFAEAWSQEVYGVIKEGVEGAGFVCRRGDDYFGRVVLVDLWQRLNEASFVVADLTSENPNVYYELGIAHTLGKEIVPIIQRGSRIPFDQQPFRILMYENSVQGLGRLSRTIPDWISSLDYNSSPQSMLLRGLVRKFNDWRQDHLRVDLSSADFSGLDLSEVDLSGAIMRSALLQRTILSSANLSGAVLTGCRLDSAVLDHCRASNIHLSEANLAGANLTASVLTNAIMIRTNFLDAAASKANLVGANLSESSMINSNFANADLRDSIWLRTKLDGINLRNATVAGMVIDRTTYVRYRTILAAADDHEQIVVED